MINAIYENGVFRPLGPVNLPEGSKVRVQPEQEATEPTPSIPPGLAAIYEVLSRRYDSGHHDTAERHNEHHP